MSSEVLNLKKPGGPRVITLRLRLPVLILVLLLFIIGLIWIFMAGVLAGRGYNAKEEIGVLASFMPSPRVAEPTGSASPEASGGTAGETSGGAETAGIDSLFSPDGSVRAGRENDTGPPGAAQDGLLRGEDLAFKDSLAAPLETPAVGANRPANTQAAQSRTAQSVQPAGTAAAAQSAQTSPATADTADTVVYEYIYQVSSFSQLHQAQSLVQRLQDAGVNAQIELHRAETSTWYRVLVSFKGRNSELEAFSARLKRFNLGAPMLRQKKAISG